MINMIQVEPPTFEVVKEQVWKDFMAKDYESIMKNNAWDVVPTSKGKSMVTSKWLFNIKHGVTHGIIEKYKARLMAQGFSHKEGEGYDDIFSTMARYTTIHSLVALYASQEWTHNQMDVNTTFLHGMLQE